MASVEQLCDHITLINESEVILQGEISAIREQYRANTFRIHYTGDPGTLEKGLKHGYELIQNEVNGKGRQAVVRVKPGTDSNDLLRNLVELVQVNAFEEILPGMNDIFIQVVDADRNSKKKGGQP
jgi:ABC-2 type transport system ATP-binding protein